MIRNVAGKEDYDIAALWRSYRVSDDAVHRGRLGHTLDVSHRNSKRRGMVSLTRKCFSIRPMRLIAKHILPPSTEWALEVELQSQRACRDRPIEQEKGPHGPTSVVPGRGKLGDIYPSFDRCKSLHASPSIHRPTRMSFASSGPTSRISSS